MVDQRVWWGAGVLIAGIGAAALTGSATAYADDGHDTGKSASSQTSTHGSQSSSPTTSRAVNVAQHSGAAQHPSVTLTTPQAGAATAAAATNPVRLLVTGTTATTLLVSASAPTAAAARPQAAHTASPAAITATAPPGPVVIETPPTLNPIVGSVLDILSSFGWKPRPLAVTLFPALAPWAGVAVPTPVPAHLVTGGSAPTTAPVVLVGHSTLDIPCGSGYTARVDWYFPAQSQDGTVNPQGMIWLQHGFLANAGFYSALATNLAAQTNSIVVVPTITSNPFACAHCWLGGDSMEQAAASLFTGDRSVLTQSAIAAGYVGTLPQPYVVAGHSLGGGFAAALAGDTIDNGAAVAPGGSKNLRGVVMFDGVPATGILQAAVPKLNGDNVPIYQIAAQNQPVNVFGSGTNELLAENPDMFDGVVLLHGSHVDSMLGGNWLIDLAAQLVTKFSPPGNTEAVYTFADGWINDMYAGDTSSGLYPGAGQAVQLGQATAYGLPDPSAQLAPIQKLFNAIRSFIGHLFGG